mmetsp:Transcript_32456/g.63411  ORF Transcript_32456/g.63411 Transcript_32456/m.63411 type:complete len:86 (-) Transcript_32456:58-315(-)
MRAPVGEFRSGVMTIDGPILPPQAGADRAVTRGEALRSERGFVAEKALLVGARSTREVATMREALQTIFIAALFRPKTRHTTRGG